jgi:hypothetical protein
MESYDETVEVEMTFYISRYKNMDSVEFEVEMLKQN